MAAISFSVVVPVFNGGALIAETLHAITAQTLPPEIIVIDDGSTDDSAQVIRAFPSVRYHYMPNGGVGRARNAGVALAQGDWIAFCDMDDLWRPTYLETVAGTLAPSSTHGFANWVDILGDEWTQQQKFWALPPDFFAGLPRPLYTELIEANPVWPSATFLRKDFFNAVGAFNPKFSRFATEDFEFTLRCNEHPGAVIVHEPLVGIRKHAGNYSKGRIRQLLSDSAILAWCADNHETGRRHQQRMVQVAMGRRSQALDEAFSQGNLPQVREIARLIPTSHQRKRTRIKVALAHTRLVPGALLRAAIGRPPEQDQVGRYAAAPATPE